MRDIRRIPRILKKLEKFWLQHPDWRLGQLISNLQGAGVQDVFYTEDDVWEWKIDDAIFLSAVWRDANKFKGK